METYDYIIVGAGTAGCVLARRLSDDPGSQVLLIEAGPPADSFWIRTPAGMARLFHNKRFNWGYSTEPDAALGGRTVFWPRGKTLGGSSAINGMIYMRGHPRDYDLWAGLGNAGWGWDDVLPYFRRIEDHAHGASPHHGVDGPLHISDPVIKHPTAQAFIEAATSIGIPRTHDLNGPPHEGVDFQQFNIRNGRRHSSYDAYVAPVRHRPNLVVRTGMHVLRILVEGRQARGVEVLQSGDRHSIAAAREVIVAGGVVNSPQLLMLSGIGDGVQLQTHGISTLVHAPGVGRNLQDHVYAPYAVRCTPNGSYNSSLRGLRKYLHGLRYLLTRRGYLAMGSSSVSAYTRSGFDVNGPDIQLTVRPVSFAFLPSGELVVDKQPGITAAVSLMQPLSTGQVMLKSPDPLQAPSIVPNYLANADDVKRLVAGMRCMRQIFTTEPLASRVIVEMQPGQSISSDAQLSDYVKATATTAFHPVGTCRMGSDPMAVVDERLRVHGVQRLRVVDASIMPTITMGNTNAPTTMIGEKAADMIRADAVPPRTVRL